MPEPPFAELVQKLVESFAQQMGSVRELPEGLLLQTTDGFLYAFLEDPNRTSLELIRRLKSEAPGSPTRLVVFSAGRLPLALSGELESSGATVVDGPRFHELARGLGLGVYIGQEPRPVTAPPPTRLLPSARLLDTLMQRARTWMDWGVPALGLRFYRQAAELKPEFLPAQTGAATALLALGLVPEAERGFTAVLRQNPDELEARIGRAAVLGAAGRPLEEIEAYRSLLREKPERLSVRAHLVAALVDQNRWAESKPEIETMLEKAPEDARLRFLHSVALDKTGNPREGNLERQRARSFGLDPERERALSEHLGLAVSEVPKETFPLSREPSPQPAALSQSARRRQPKRSAGARSARPRVFRKKPRPKSVSKLRARKAK